MEVVAKDNSLFEEWVTKVKEERVRSKNPPKVFYLLFCLHSKHYENAYSLTIRVRIWSLNMRPHLEVENL